MSWIAEFMKTNLNWWHFSKCQQGTKMTSPAIIAAYILLVTVKRLRNSFRLVVHCWVRWLSVLLKSFFVATIGVAMQWVCGDSKWPQRLIFKQRTNSDFKSSSTESVSCVCFCIWCGCTCSVVCCVFLLPKSAPTLFRISVLEMTLEKLEVHCWSWADCLQMGVSSGCRWAQLPFSPSQSFYSNTCQFPSWWGLILVISS